jgi:hypothetical protein
MMLGKLKIYLKRYRFLRILKRHYHLRYDRPKWGKMLQNDLMEWKSAILKSKGRERILIGTSIGAHLGGTSMDSLIAVALTLRNAEVHILLCDSVLPACLESAVEYFPNIKSFILHGQKKDLCENCFSTAYKMFDSLGFVIHRYSELVTKEEFKRAEEISSTMPLEEVKNHMYGSVAVGEHAFAGALRFYSLGFLDGSTESAAVLRRYFKSSLLTTYAMDNLFKKFDFKCVVTHHGIYVPHGIICELARREKVRVVTWIPSYRKKTFIFSHDDTYHRTMMTEPVEKWEKMKWDKKTEEMIMSYLKSRWYGTNDWIFFHEKPCFDVKSIAEETGIDFSKPCIGMLTNVLWDAQIHYPANIFLNILDWALKTIDYFKNRPELQLIIRVHPAELIGARPSRQPIIPEIKKVFPSLPKNIFLIGAENPISTYALMSQCNAVIIYGTKTGVELASMGIPVIVAGEAWIRNKGISIDPDSITEYYSLLDKLPFDKMMDEEKTVRARKYAFHFFFHRMIPLEFMAPAPNSPALHSFHINGLGDLMPGKHKGLDVICNGILNGSDFIYRPKTIM